MTIYSDNKWVDESSSIEEAFSSRTAFAKEQTVIVYDLISEGEIQGLVHGPASVFLNNDRLMEIEQASIPGFNLNLSISNSGLSGTITGNTVNLPNSLNAIEGVRSIILRGITSSTASSISLARGLQTGSANTDVIGYDITLSSPIATLGDYVQSEPFVIDYSSAHYLTGYHARLVNSVTKESFAGYIVASGSTTTCRWIPLASITLGQGPIDISSPSTYSLVIDGIYRISSISNNSVTYIDAPPSGTYSFDILGAFVTDSGIEVEGATNWEKATTQFRVGTLYQPKMIEFGQGTGPSSTFTHSFTPISLKQNVKFEDESYYGEVGVSDAAVTVTPPLNDYARADEITLIFSYFSLYSRRSNGAIRDGFAVYEIAVLIDGVENIVHGNLVHTAASETAIIFEETIDLQKFKPFNQFSVVVRRKYPDTGRFVDQFGKRGGEDEKGEHLQFTSGEISGALLTIKSSFNYPLSAYSGITFSSRQFQRMPSRSYHVRGLKVKVPSNYITREESLDNIASYNRNTTTGAIEASYQDWDGSFREEVVYTNNPAWIFYDLVTNSRYGLGRWISADQIDKYALYKIARYCDELVDDGYGALEPRFTCNLYLSSAEEAYKVLKDIATIFTGILYWINGQVTLITDSAKDPVYTFSKANIIGGTFNYETSGSKTRPNQYIVSWNDPERDFSTRPAIVEDRADIIETNQIRQESVVAFGCTSEAQAIRYGRWKLWTSKWQTEIVSFSTSLEGKFLLPGDIIRIQDADRYALQYSGRILSSGSPTTTIIPLDREVTLNAASEYYLSVILVSPCAFLMQDGPVSIEDDELIPNTIIYQRGEKVDYAWVNGVYTAIDTEEKAANSTDHNGTPILLDWASTTKVETSIVDDPGGTYSSLTVQTPFSTAPSVGTVWALREFNSSGAYVAGTAKDYKVLTISESSKNIVDIIAVEHFNEKFDAIDDDVNIQPWEEANPLYPALSTETPLQPPRWFFSVGYPNYNEANYDILLTWVPPVIQPDVNNPSVYINDPRLAGYELLHTVPPAMTGYSDSIYFSSKTVVHRFNDIDPGEYLFKLACISTRGKKTRYIKTRVELDKIADNPFPRGPMGTPLGGRSNKEIVLEKEYDPARIKFSDSNWTFSTHQAPLNPITNLEDPVTYPTSYIQDISGIQTETFDAKDNWDKILDSFYILFDYDDPQDRLKLLRWYTDGFPKSDIPFWYNAGNGIDRQDEYNPINTPPDSTILGQLTPVGTFLTFNSTNIVIGSGTNWRTNINPGDVVRFSYEKYARVVYVYSDTSILIDRLWEEDTIGGTLYRNFQIDIANDCIIGRVYRDSTEGFVFDSYVDINDSVAYEALAKSISALVDTHDPVKVYVDSIPPSEVNPSWTGAPSSPQAVKTGQAESGSFARKLVDSGANFSATVAVGDVVRNLSDPSSGTFSHAVIVSVDSGSIEHEPLSGGAANNWSIGDYYDIVDFTIGDIWLDSNSLDPQYDNWRWEDTTGNEVGDAWVGPNNPDLVGRSFAETLRASGEAAVAAATIDKHIKTWAQDTPPVGYTADSGNAEASTPDVEGRHRYLECTTANFTSNVSVGDILRNTTDGSSATVTEIVSNTKIRHTPLSYGSENDWDLNDKFEIGGPSIGDFWIDTNSNIAAGEYSSTSTDSETISVGTKTLTVGAGLYYTASDVIRLTNFTGGVLDVSNYMEGAISSYNRDTGDLVVIISLVEGSGTYSAWKLTPQGTFNTSNPDTSADWADNAFFRFDGTNWVFWDVNEAATNANQALIDAAAAQTAANKSLNTYIQPEPPIGTSYNVGDVWLDDDTVPPYQIYRWQDSGEGLQWEATPNDILGRHSRDLVYRLRGQEALNLAIQYDNKIKGWAQDAEPTFTGSGTVTTSDSTGQILYDSSGSFLTEADVGDYVRNTTDNSFGVVLEVISNTVLVLNRGLQSEPNPPSTPSLTFEIGDNYEIGGPSEGDYWIDTNSNVDPGGGLPDNAFYRFEGGSWVFQDPNEASAEAGQALLDAASALAVAQEGIATNTLFVQGSAPGGDHIEGDIWLYNLNAPPFSYADIYRWTNSSWVASSDDLLGTAYVDILNATDDATLAASIVDGKVRTYVQDAPGPSEKVSGTSNTGDPNGRILEDITADFSAVVIGDYVHNTTTDEYGQVLRVLSSTKLYHTRLTSASGLEGSWTSTDDYTVGGPSVGDFWIDTAGSVNVLHRYSGSAWVEYQDSGIQEAITTADGKNTVYLQISEPSVGQSGDIWVDTDNNNAIYFYTGGVGWSPYDINNAEQNATLAAFVAQRNIQQATIPSPAASGVNASADSLGTTLTQTGAFSSVSNPAGMRVSNLTDGSYAVAISKLSNNSIKHSKLVGGVDNDWDAGDDWALDGFVAGDIWIDTDDSDRLYTWNGASWENSSDLADAAQLTANDASDTADAAQLTANDASAAATEALTAKTLYEQTSQPTGGTYYVGDIWINTTGGAPYASNDIFRYNGSTWVSDTTNPEGLARIQALNAQSTASTAQTTADSKAKTTRSTTEPVGPNTGDIWVNTGASDKTYTYTGSIWSETGVTADKVVDGTNNKITTITGASGANYAYTGLNNSGRPKLYAVSTELSAGSNPTTGVIVDSAGVRGYSSSTLQFDLQTDGDLFLNGQLEVAGTTTGATNACMVIPPYRTGSNNGIAVSTKTNVAGNAIVAFGDITATSSIIVAQTFGTSGAALDARAYAVSGTTAAGQFANSNSSADAIILVGGVFGNDVNFTDDVDIDLTLTVGGIANFDNTTDSSSVSTGALIVDGGVGIAKRLYVGGYARITDSTSTTSSSTGALVVTGGIASGENIVAGTTIQANADNEANAGIFNGSSFTSTAGKNVLTFALGSGPGSQVNQISIHAEDNGDAKATLSLDLEAAVENFSNASGKADDTNVDIVRIIINGVNYWLPLYNIKP